jgi:hypothetical protein
MDDGAMWSLAVTVTVCGTDPAGVVVPGLVGCCAVCPLGDGIIPEEPPHPLSASPAISESADETRKNAEELTLDLLKAKRAGIFRAGGSVILRLTGSFYKAFAPRYRRRLDGCSLCRR